MLTLLLVLVSFLPSELKVALGTRGPLHFWAHLYAFAVLSVLFLGGLRSFKRRAAAVAGLALLGLAIEMTQAHWHMPALERNDLFCDLFGVVMGLIVSLVRGPAPQGLSPGRDAPSAPRI